jgi:peptide/nickel transport system permease protein
MRFGEFVARRVILAIVTLIGLSLVIFYLSRVLPADPGRLALGPYATQSQVATYDRELGLDRPLYQQYFYWLWAFLHGQWGQSVSSKHNVLIDVEYYFPATFELISISIVITALIGVPIGVIAASRREKPLSGLIRVLWIIGIAIPPFTVALLLQLIGARFNYPITSQLSNPSLAPPHITGMYLVDSLLTLNFGIFGNAAEHLLLPEIALSLAGIGQIAQLTYSGLLDQTHEDYYLALKAFGAPSFATNFKYALRSALVPVLTVLGLLYASLIANAFLIEVIFQWNGLSSYAVVAMQSDDFNAVVATVIIIGLFYVTLNLLIDLGLGYVDPRIRLGEGT